MRSERSRAKLTPRALSHNDVKRFKHRHRDHNGGGDQQQHEHREAQRAVAVLAIEPPNPDAGFGAVVDLVTTDAVGTDFGTELGLKVAQTPTEVSSHQGRY